MAAYCTVKAIRSGVATLEGAGVRFLLVAGKPLREPVAWRGPIVMNTEAELRIAFGEYAEGTFLKHKAVLD